LTTQPITDTVSGVVMCWRRSSSRMAPSARGWPGLNLRFT
jgi:hypothetical protein